MNFAQRSFKTVVLFLYFFLFTDGSSAQNFHVGAPINATPPAGSSIDDDETEFGPDVDDVDDGENAGTTNQSSPGVEARARHWSDDIETSDLRFSSQEIRRDRRYGLGVVVGPAIPWNGFALEGLYFLTGDIAATAAIGVGAFEAKSKLRSISLEMKARTQSAVVGGMYFFSEQLPIALVPTLGYVRWKGNLGSIGAADLEDAEHAGRMHSTVDAHGAVAGVALALHFVWKTGFYLNYTLFHVAKPFVLSAKYSSTEPDVSERVNVVLNEVATWGLVNLKVGYQF
jgi:hypothetical protein